MTGESDGLYFWPNDPDFDGPYGYNALIIQKDGFRLGCDAPSFRSAVMRTSLELGGGAAEAHRGQPRRMEEAFESTARVEL